MSTDYLEIDYDGEEPPSYDDPPRSGGAKRRRSANKPKVAVAAAFETGRDGEPPLQWHSGTLADTGTQYDTKLAHRFLKALCGPARALQIVTSVPTQMTILEAVRGHVPDVDFNTLTCSKTIVYFDFRCVSL